MNENLIKEADKEIVYGYIYNREGYHSIGVKMTKNQIPNFIVETNLAPKVTITDRSDNLILNTMTGYVNRCPDQEYLIKELLPALVPMQMGEEESNLKILGANSEHDILDLKDYFLKFSFDIEKYIG